MGITAHSEDGIGCPYGHSDHGADTERAAMEATRGIHAAANPGWV
jgi:hypothetical protein